MHTFLSKTKQNKTKTTSLSSKQTKSDCSSNKLYSYNNEKNQDNTMLRNGVLLTNTLKRVCCRSRSANNVNFTTINHHHQQQQRMMASTLVISEPLGADGITPAGTQSTVTAATKLSSSSSGGHGDTTTINLLVVGSIVPTKIPMGISKVFHVPIDDKLSETVANSIIEIIDDDYNIVIGTASKFGSTVIPRTAALLDVSPITDILEIQDEKTFIRPMYAGNVLAKVISHPGPNGSNRKVLSVRPTCFDKADLIDCSSSDIVTVDTVQAFDKAKWVGEAVSKSDRPDLGSANIVVSGGRGIKSGDNFHILEVLADKLGAAVGASRAAVDAGFCPNDWQVGQTGKVVAPDLYIAAGISGAIQHLSGMKDSKVIVAINTDPDAPIFQVADYGLKQDLFEAIPELTEKI